MCVISAFTLFPNNVLPVMSSLFDAQRKPTGRLGIFHGWIGVFHCASYRTENNNPVLKKWFQSQKRQNEKNNNNCQLSQDRGLMHNGPQRGKVGS